MNSIEKVCNYLNQGQQTFHTLPMQNNVLYSFKFRKIFLLIFVTFYLQTLFSNSYAFDTTDTTPPKYEISVIDNGANQYGRVVIKISAKDDKNEIKLSSNMVMTGARLTSTPISGVAPLCGANDQNMTLDIRGTIFTNDFSNPTSLKGNLRTFYIVFGVNLGKLPEGCIEWRLPSQNQYRDFFENTNFDVNVIKDLAPCNNVTLGANTILMELLNQFEASMKQFLVEQAATDKAATDKAAADKAAADKAAADKAAANKKVTITCIKGKVSKLITGINPKCPVNYKKK